MTLDPRIGVLNSGKYYCFPEGHGRPELVGTLEEVEIALGIRPAPVAANAQEKCWDVKLIFQFPAWDEKDGIPYPGIRAKSKAAAITIARRQAQNDGHAVGGRGRYWFSAREAES